MTDKNILVPIDGSDQALAAVREAAIMANALDSKLIVISIVEENPFANTDFYYFGADATTMKKFFDEGVVSGNGKYSTLRIFTPTSFNDIQHGIFA